MIHYVQHADIDRKKWDATVELAMGGMPYALSWYLDIISPQWDALVDDDYDAIMPVPVKRKYGLRYVIQPPFAQQLGVFSSKMLYPKTVEHFCNMLTHLYGYVNIQLNYSNVSPFFSKVFPNYVLDLNRDYTDLRIYFSENHRRNIRKILKDGQLVVNEGFSNAEVETFIQQQESFKSLIPFLMQLTREAIARNAGNWQVAVDQNGNIVSVIFWLKFRYRHIYLYSLSSEAGKLHRASFFLVNEYIRQNSGNTILIDFEGSRIPGVARFFEGFGARLEYYPIFQYHNVGKLLLRSFMPF
ncbi:MAG: hypothetical protein WHT29_06310 [Bacteroidales bacterium]